MANSAFVSGPPPFLPPPVRAGGGRVSVFIYKGGRAKNDCHNMENKRGCGKKRLNAPGRDFSDQALIFLVKT